MLARIIQFLIGALLAGGGGYLGWAQRLTASNLFPPSATGLPWLLILAILALSAGIVFLVSAVHPHPERRARIAAESARRSAELDAADSYYSSRNSAADSDWRGGDIPAPTAPPAAPLVEPVQAAPATLAPVVKPVATSVAPPATPFPATATLAPIPVATAPPPLAAPIPVAAALDVAAPPAVAGPFAAIRSAIAEGRLDEADKLLAEARDTAQGLELAELTALAGDHAAAAGRQSNAKWLWRLALKRFGELNAMDTAVAKAVAESLRTAG